MDRMYQLATSGLVGHYKSEKTVNAEEYSYAMAA